MIEALSSMYGAAAAWRRRWYARRPDRRRHLSRPVVSVGNLRVGGAGKTPVVEHVARLLVARGERPAVLSRGYARRRALDGATVVADGTKIVADVESAGDEPLMLARAVPGLIVVVGADRFLSGILAERRLGATVHLLDDGFQHVQLARDVDLLVASEDDLSDRPLPTGRLREQLSAASVADAALVDAPDAQSAERVARALRIPDWFRVVRALAEPCAQSPRAARVFAVAGIAKPDRFFADLSAAGWDVAGTLAFHDHHRFDGRDLARIAAAARDAGAAAIVTTAKDVVRLPDGDIAGLPVAAVPLVASIEPAGLFQSWLLERLP